MVADGGLAEVRHKLAAAVGFAARKLWRRRDLETEDELILDLLVEALDRMGRLYRPRTAAHAAAALASAPPHVGALVARLEPLASRPAASVLAMDESMDVEEFAVDGSVLEAAPQVPLTPAPARARSRSGTPPPATRLHGAGREPCVDVVAEDCASGRKEKEESEPEEQGTGVGEAEGSSSCLGLPATVEAAGVLVRAALVGKDLSALGPVGRCAVGQDVVAEVLEGMEEQFGFGSMDVLRSTAALVTAAVSEELSICLAPAF